MIEADTLNPLQFETLTKEPLREPQTVNPKLQTLLPNSET